MTQPISASSQTTSSLFLRLYWHLISIGMVTCPRVCTMYRLFVMTIFHSNITKSLTNYGDFGEEVGTTSPRCLSIGPLNYLAK